MLQIIHQMYAAPRASSIYCQWIRRDGREGSPLVAVWIDSEMRSFEREFALNTETEVLAKGALDEPGGVPALQLLTHLTTSQITMHHS